MRSLAVVTFALISIGTMLLSVIVADSAGATRADVDGYAQRLTVDQGVTPATRIMQEPR